MGNGQARSGYREPGWLLAAGFDGVGPGIGDFGVFLGLPLDFSSVSFFFCLIPLTFAALILQIMLAVVKIAGQQFKVQKDQTLYVPRIAGNAGDTVEFGEVLLSDGDALAVGKDVKAVIKAEILDHVQGDKVIAFKMKRRKGFRKKHGHRTHYTKIRINEIA
jgi:large subunit ribosomal protein L21